MIAKKEKVMGFSQLLKRIRNSNRFPTLLRTAFRTGWLTDGVFYTKLTDKEFEKVKEVYDESQEAKKAEMLDVEKNLPGTVGVELDKIKLNAKIAKLTAAASDKEVNVDAELFLSLRRRHPKALIYLSPKSETIVFSEEKCVSAALMVN
jgi:hypothetical protein